LRHELNELENAISLLDHRRYDAETRHAQAIDAGAPAQTAAARLARRAAGCAKPAPKGGMHHRPGALPALRSPLGKRKKG